MMPRSWAACMARGQRLDQRGRLPGRQRACRRACSARLPPSTNSRREERPAVVLRRPRRSARCSGAAAGRRPRPRCWKRADRSVAGQRPPDRIIFSATTRSEPAVPRLVDDAHAAAADRLEHLVPRHLRLVVERGPNPLNGDLPVVAGEVSCGKRVRYSAGSTGSPSRRPREKLVLEQFRQTIRPVEAGKALEIILNPRRRRGRFAFAMSFPTELQLDQDQLFERSVEGGRIGRGKCFSIGSGRPAFQAASKRRRASSSMMVEGSSWAEAVMSRLAAAGNCYFSRLEERAQRAVRSTT